MAGENHQALLWRFKKELPGSGKPVYKVRQPALQAHTYPYSSPITVEA